MESEKSEKPALKALRKRVKKSRSAVAKDVGVSSERVIYAWEVEGVIPETPCLVLLAKALNASLYEVVESLGFDMTGIPLDCPEDTKNAPTE